MLLTNHQQLHTIKLQQIEKRANMSIYDFKVKTQEGGEISLADYKGKVLLPKVFKDENKIEEIKGLYVPFWLFDADADADSGADGETDSVETDWGRRSREIRRGRRPGEEGIAGGS